MNLKRLLKKMITILFASLGLLVSGLFIFLNHYPAFGGRPQKEMMQRAPTYADGKFTNLYSTKVTFGWSDYKVLLKKLVKGNPNRRPKNPLPAIQWSREEINALEDSATTAIWFRHSAFYLKMNGKHLLLDPMFSSYPSPVPGLTKKRFNETLPVAIAELPAIDVILISHDHYDHLDYQSVLQLKDRTKRFLVPLGVGAHLEAWGVDKEKITELYWYEAINFEGITFTCTPTQHFSGRSLTDKFGTLWCSWVINGNHKIFFSGDSGYFGEFKKIGETYGPFDACLMECGQYDELWKDIHMFPEETVQAHLDLKGKILIPIHWGAFSLGMHDWNDPMIRLAKACKEKGVSLATPKIGEPVLIGEAQLFSDWVKNEK